MCIRDRCEGMELTNEVFSNPFDYMRNLKDGVEKDVAIEMEPEEPSSSQQSFPSKSLLKAETESMPSQPAAPERYCFFKTRHSGFKKYSVVVEGDQLVFERP